MKTWEKEFDKSNEDTCKSKWVFNLKDVNGNTIIESVEIEKNKKGCPGHPKTISALLNNKPLKGIDTKLLSETKCGYREKSCGMILAECINEIKNEDD